MPYYTTWGPHYGCCGHLHRTMEAAYDCLFKNPNDLPRKRRFGRQIREVASRKELQDFDPELGPGKRVSLSLEVTPITTIRRENLGKVRKEKPGKLRYAATGHLVFPERDKES
ncbi:MAG: hypothetical protein HPY75_03270 [Actinobacteria bacterium]|nr:hypothetical protein [Actinomycetota bacterium]